MTPTARRLLRVWCFAPSGCVLVPLIVTDRGPGEGLTQQSTPGLGAGMATSSGAVAASQQSLLLRGKGTGSRSTEACDLRGSLDSNLDLGLAGAPLP